MAGHDLFQACHDQEFFLIYKLKFKLHSWKFFINQMQDRPGPLQSSEEFRYSNNGSNSQRITVYKYPENKSLWRESNPRSPPYQGGAIPLCHKGFFCIYMRMWSIVCRPYQGSALPAEPRRHAMVLLLNRSWYV
jgi:hypothetical protein